MPAHAAPVARIEMRPQLLQRNRIRLLAARTPRIRTAIAAVPRIIRLLALRLQLRKNLLHIHRPL